MEKINNIVENLSNEIYWVLIGIIVILIVATAVLFQYALLVKEMKEHKHAMAVKNASATWNSDSNNLKIDITTLKFIDLGLPSGKLWATENIKDENGDEAFFSFDDSINIFGKNLPSKDDWKELFDNSSYSWNEERKGYDVTGPNGNSIFLPAAGYRYGVFVRNVGSFGYYWSSSVFNENDAYLIDFYSGYLAPQNIDYRYNGFSIRLVR